MHVSSSRPVDFQRTSPETNAFVREFTNPLRTKLTYEVSYASSRLVQRYKYPPRPTLPGIILPHRPFTWRIKRVNNHYNVLCVLSPEKKNIRDTHHGSCSLSKKKHSTATMSTLHLLRNPTPVKAHLLLLPLKYLMYTDPDSSLLHCLYPNLLQNLLMLSRPPRVDHKSAPNHPIQPPSLSLPWPKDCKCCRHDPRYFKTP